MFAKHKYNLRKISIELAKVTIDFGDNLVPCYKPYRLGEISLKELNKIINEDILNDIDWRDIIFIGTKTKQVMKNYGDFYWVK